MKVKNHNKYRLFQYENYPSDTFQLGDVVFKNSKDGPEVGVIIQTHNSVDFRTDMFGNCSLDEITFASETQITELRPELLPDINGTSKTISIAGQYVSLLELYNGDLRVSVTPKGIIELKDELKHRKNPSQCFSVIFEDIVEKTNFQYCTSAHYVLEHSPKLPIITTAHYLGPEGKWVRNADGNWWMYKGYGNFVRELILKGEVVLQLV
jgi:hypothetical protein